MTRQLQPGDTAPDFTLTSHTGDPWTLSTALERGPVVLFFYPKNDTPVCVAEACNFRDRHEVFVGSGAQVVGVSRDTVESHKSFAGRYDLPYTLLSDPDAALRAQYGVKKTLGFFDGRVTFVIDPGGVVRCSFSAALDAKAHVQHALDTIKQITGG